ncbi:MAG: FecR domain-containing protein [Proteobacteria bacterium]|nr:FecR domain-containing protein [Pseudomonadota bacterium]
MNDHTPQDDRQGEDADLAALLRRIGPRPTPAADITAEVRAAVAAEWRATVAARQPKRRFTQPWLTLAASVAVVAVAVAVALPRWKAAGGPVAMVARVTGDAEVRHSTDGTWQPLTATSPVATSDEIRTSGSGRVALRRPDGLEVRLDTDTQLAFAGRARARLATGSIYVDAGAPGSGSGALVVGTPYGDVRHVGTQYLASVNDGVLRVAVREGSIAIDRGRVPVVARAGESLAVHPDGSVARAQIDPHGQAWHWAAAVAPEFAIEGRSLDEFLAWAGRETGRKIVYTSADAAREAEQTQLKGSTSGLAPEAAVAAVFASQPALHHVIAAGQIRIERTSR